MSRALAALARGRRRAEANQPDECVITRVTGPPGPMDPDTGVRAPAPTTTVYAGRCKVQTYEPHEAKPQAGEHVWTVQRYFLHVPISAGQVLVDDRVLITAAVSDPDLAGRTYRIAGTHAKSRATARRLLLDEVTG